MNLLRQSIELVHLNIPHPDNSIPWIYHLVSLLLPLLELLRCVSRPHDHPNILGRLSLRGNVDSPGSFLFLSQIVALTLHVKVVHHHFELFSVVVDDLLGITG